MIIFDSNQIIIAAVASASKDFGKDVCLNDVRSYFLMTILNIRKKFLYKYGNSTILAFDSKTGYWRNEVFPHYKIKRKETKKAAPFDFKFAMACIDNIYNEMLIETHFHVIRVHMAEGDDVIGCIVKHFYPIDESPTPFGPIYDGKGVLIISSDSDYVQLHNRKNVDQYSTIHGKFVTSHNPEKFLFEKIIRGDTGDSIPSCLSEADHFVNPVSGRQKPIKSSDIDTWWNSFVSSGCHNDKYKSNFDRNKRLIDFEHIPVDISNEIIYTLYNNKAGSKTQFMNYVVKHRSTSLIDNLNYF